MKNLNKKMIAGLLMLVLLAGIILGESNLAAFAMESKEKEKVSLSFNDKGKLFFEKERGNQACFESGETVKVYFDAIEDYALTELNVYSASGNIEYEMDMQQNCFTFVKPDESVMVSAVFSWMRTTGLNKVGKAEVVDGIEYIINNIDEKYIALKNIKEIVPADGIWVKDTLADGSKLKEKTIDAMTSVVECDDPDFDAYALISQTDSVSILYDADPTSDYYVSYVDKMTNDNESYISDFCFAYTNMNGEVIKDCIFDRKTGLAYVPKKYTVENKNGLGVLNVQVQLLHIFKNDEAKAGVNVIIEKDGIKGKTAESGKIKTDAVYEEIYIQLAEDKKALSEIKEENLRVYVDGISNSDFSYSEESGVLAINAGAAGIDTVEININKEKENNAVTDLLLRASGIMGLKANAADATTMRSIPVSGQVIKVSDVPVVGDSWEMNWWYNYIGRSIGDYNLKANSGTATFYDEECKAAANSLYNGVNTSSVNAGINVDGAYAYTLDINGNVLAGLSAVQDYVINNNGKYSLDKAVSMISGNMNGELITVGGPRTDAVSASKGWYTKSSNGRTYVYDGWYNNSGQTYIENYYRSINTDIKKAYISTGSQNLKKMVDNNIDPLACSYVIYMKCNHSGASFGENNSRRVMARVIAVNENEGTMYIAYTSSKDNTQTTSAIYKYRYVLPEEPLGSVCFKKESSMKSITDNNKCYSFEGAVYSLFYKKESNPVAVYNNDGYVFNQGIKVAEFVVGADGNGRADKLNSAEFKNLEISTDKLILGGLPAGFYALAETKRPDNNSYAIEREIHRFEINRENAENTVMISGSDIPYNDPMLITIKKEGLNSASFDMSGTVFRLDYYDDFYEKIEELPEECTKTWYLSPKKAKDGTYICAYDEAYITKQAGYISDSLYTSSENKPVLPLGTIVLREVKAAQGFVKNSGELKDSKGNVFPGNVFIGRVSYSEELGRACLKGIYGKQSALYFADYPEGAELLMTNEAVRGDISLRKKNLNNDEGMKNISFRLSLLDAEGKITESNIITTGTEGEYDSINDDKLKFAGKKGLVYGKYMLEEIRNDANKGYILADPIIFEISEDKQKLEFIIYNAPEPELSTFEADVNMGKHFSFSGKIKVKDTVKYNNLEAGKEYTVKGILMKKSEDEIKPLKDKNGNLICANSYIVTPGEFSKNRYEFCGETELLFEFEDEKENGTCFVIFEYLFEGKDDEKLKTDENDRVITGDVYKDKEGNEVKHADANDVNQTGYIPVIHTKARDSKTGENIALAAKDTVLIDKVSISGIIPDEDYVIKGRLYIKNDKDFYKNENGEILVVEKELKASAAEPRLELVFEFDASELKGKDIVVFEELYYGDDLIAKHEDADDVDQTISFPEGKTKAANKEGNGNLINNDGLSTIVDKVMYNNLIPGKNYVLKAVLMDKADNSVIKRENGEEFYVLKDFIPKEKSGEEELTIVIDSKFVAGKTLVVFEECTLDGKKVFIHADINDGEQTVFVPEIPEEPEKPETPDVPETPDTPKTPETPNKPSEPSSPKTADDFDSRYFLFALISVITLGFSERRKKKHR
ncbi:MAG: VaFE repeat-containing surface-anchored protein [Lachnospiraceae bacterium]|nr:VaFE repeat-containing surface-anchored protein [Lachnospiraceae bacterium]